jgi:hypothetical protein
MSSICISTSGTPSNVIHQASYSGPLAAAPATSSRSVTWRTNCGIYKLVARL